MLHCENAAHGLVLATKLHHCHSEPVLVPKWPRLVQNRDLAGFKLYVTLICHAADAVQKSILYRHFRMSSQSLKHSANAFRAKIDAASKLVLP